MEDPKGDEILDPGLESNKIDMPGTLPGPTTRRPGRLRLSRAAAPWVHAGLQSGTLDVEGVALDLAMQIDPLPKEELVGIFRHFFQNISKFDYATCDLKTAEKDLDTHMKALETFHHLGIETLAPPPLGPLKASRSRSWIQAKFIPMALADRLAWVAQPAELAPEVYPREASTALLARVRGLVSIAAMLHFSSVALG